MTDTDHSIENQAVIDIALAAAEPHKLGLEEVYAIATADGTVTTIDTFEIDDKYRDAPRRAKGTAALTTVASFTDFVETIGGDNGIVPLFADLDKRTVQAIFNGTTADGPGHGDHRARFTATHTPAWLRWMGVHNKPLNQVAFAEHLEDCLADIVTPDGAELLDVASSFQANTTVKFKEAFALPNGERKLVYEETIDAKAGQAGELEVPDGIGLSIAVFEGEPRQEVAARLRYRITPEGIRILIVLDRPEEIVRDHFDVLVKSIEAALHPVWFGAPTA